MKRQEGWDEESRGSKRGALGEEVIGMRREQGGGLREQDGWDEARDRMKKQEE